MRKLQSNYRRLDVLGKMLREFMESRYYGDRITFLDFCESCFDHYSRKWCKENLVNACLDICSREIILSARIRIISFLCTIKKIIVLPGDQSLLDRVFAIFFKFLLDPNPYLYNMTRSV